MLLRYNKQHRSGQNVKHKRNENDYGNDSKPHYRHGRHESRT